MKGFSLVFNSKIDNKELFDMLRSLVGGSISYKLVNSIVVFEYDYDNKIEITDLIEAYFNETMSDGIIYTSFDNLKKLDKEQELAIKLIPYLPKGKYDLKSIALHSIKANLSSSMLDLILEGSGVGIDFITGFCENDLNVTQASKIMYVHRNTMNYKLDKLNQASGFDLRRFNDAYILYSLI